MARDDTSLAEDAEFGPLALQEIIQKSGGRFADATLNAYVKAVGARLTRASENLNIKFQFAITNDSSPNLFSLPGGYIVLTRGLLAKLSNEAQLAALLGHEFGHVTARHADNRLRKRASAFGFVKMDNLNGYPDSLFDQPYSRDQEREADRLGIDFMVKAGYTPVDSAQVEEDLSPAGDQNLNLSALNGLVLNHPFSAQRVTENRLYIQQKYRQISGGVEDDAEFSLAFDRLRHTRQGFVSFDQARKLERQGELAEAIRLYHQALMEAPDEPLILCSLGLAYLRSDDLIPARRYLIKAINFQADYYQSRLALGYVYQQKQQYWQALEELEAGYKLLPTLEGGYLLAEVREQVGDKEGARTFYTAVAKADAGGKLGLNAATKLKQLEK